MNQSLFSQPLNVINVGIAMFSDDLKKTAYGGDSARLDAARPGNMRVVNALDALADSALAEKIAAANQQALERIIQSHPVLTGFDQAINVVPGMTAKPFSTPGRRSRGKRCAGDEGAVTGALVFEGLAKILLMPPNWPLLVKSPSHHATSMTASGPWPASPPPPCLCILSRTKPTATSLIPT